MKKAKKIKKVKRAELKKVKGGASKPFLKSDMPTRGGR